MGDVKNKRLDLLFKKIQKDNDKEVVDSVNKLAFKTLKDKVPVKLRLK